MPDTYQQVKDATIALLTTYSHDHDIAAGYGMPLASPKYDADTKLASVGINAYVRKAITKQTNASMGARFSKWVWVGPLDLADPDTIGAFIELMCLHARVGVPDGEPT